MAKDTGKVNIHGKEYETVASRVQKFRSDEKIGTKYSIETELVDANEKTVVMKALIKGEDGRIIATGYAEENRNASMINKTSALENCETSAIGRALANFGMAGTEYASADEVANAIHQQKSSNPKPSEAIATAEQKQKIAALLALQGVVTQGMPDVLERIYNVPVGSVMTFKQAEEILKDLQKSEQPF